ncbi:ABC transporter ATP-binding protein [Siminovitchia sp. 179-K 8D1 HS]|uniref:ABC transporter ATP-binding protein n=1 Tax=Siminovitchia sp. 179-K 8D1 HS TaxID=3142385 RepID=UPI0039A039D0
MNRNVLLEVKNLKKYFPIRGGGIVGKKITNHVRAVDDVSFQVYEGESFGVVGESGCGKSTTGRVILRLLDPTSGTVYFQGKNLAEVSEKEMRMLRKDIQIIFQDPFASLNPRMRVKHIIEEPLVNFNIVQGKENIRKKVEEIAEQVGLTKKQIERYPHEFSGGQRQRIGIARALASKPKLIIADEPVSALDVSIQSQVLNLLTRLQKEHGFTFIFISHDLSVVKHFCDRICVMYLGQIVEVANKNDLYKEPLHPYSQALLSAIPKPDPKLKKERIILTGDVPSPSNPPSGCPFHPRCAFAMDVCRKIRPRLKEQDDGRSIACHLYDSELSQNVI